MSFLGRRLPFTFFYVFALSVFSFGQNPIVIENGNPGNPSSEWSVPDFRDNRIAGFSTKMSLNRGQTVRFKINVQSGVSYTLKIYRLGYYQGNGARLMQNLGTLSGTVQPGGISDPVTGLLDCSNWSESASWNIPSTAVSGLYIAKLERSGGEMMRATRICIFNFRMPGGRHITDTAAIRCMMEIPVSPTGMR